MKDQCPVCKRAVPVNKNGGLRAHRTRKWEATVRTCPGSGGPRAVLRA